MKLYYHKTTGGAEYLTDTFIKWKHNGKEGKEGTFTEKTKYIVRIDGDIEKDAEITVRDNPAELKKLLKEAYYTIDGLLTNSYELDRHSYEDGGHEESEQLLTKIKTILKI